MLLCSTSSAMAQLDPVITGDTVLCMSEGSTLTCNGGPYESYQWYMAYNSDTFALPGATDQTLWIDYDGYLGAHLFVEVTQSGDTVQSSPVAIYAENWNYQGFRIYTSGNYVEDGMGGLTICEGDTIYINVATTPTDIEVTWYNNGNVIPSQNAMIEVTEAGSYYFTGTPDLCPNLVIEMGYTIEVTEQPCSAAGLDENTLEHASIYPNPASDEMTVTHSSEPIKKIEIRNIAGELVSITTVNQLSATISLDKLCEGTYFVTVNYSNGSEVLPLTIQ